MTDLSTNFSIKKWPELYLPRLLAEKLEVEGLPQPARDRFGIHLNVYVEAGYALKHHEQNRLIYLFEPQDAGDTVPSDLNTFKYVLISQAAEIPGKLKPEIIAITKGCRCNNRWR